MNKTKELLAAARRFVSSASCHVGSRAGPLLVEIDKELAGMPFPFDDIRDAGNVLVDYCHGASAAAGWWGELEQTGDLPYDVAEVRGDGRFGKALVAQKLCLIHSEVSEAMEGHRKGLADDKLPHRPMIEVELADAVIRIADLAGALGLDLGGAIAEKMEYNRKRPDHKPENRKADGGKKY